MFALGSLSGKRRDSYSGCSSVTRQGFGKLVGEKPLEQALGVESQDSA